MSTDRLQSHEAAQYLGCSIRTLRRLVAARLIKVERITRRKHFYSRTDLDRYREAVTV